MRQASLLYFIARLSLALCVMPQPRFALAQDQAAKTATHTETTKKPPPAGIGQIEQNYVGTAPGQAALKLTANSQAAETGQPIRFTVTWNRKVDRVPVSYLFYWDNNTKPEDQTNQSVEHTYLTSGPHTVHVVAYRPGELPSAANPTSNYVTIKVQAAVKLSVALTAKPQNIHAGDSVTFWATVSQNARNAQYTFSFGDGSTSQSGSNQATHIYNSSGVFNATATVSITDGRQSAVSSLVPITVTQVTEVTETPPRPIVNVTSENTGTLVVGDNAVVSATLDPPEANRGFEFNWNDGSRERVGSQGIASHRYSKSGTYNVTVTAETEETYKPLLSGSAQLIIGEAPTPPPPPPPSTPPPSAVWGKVAISAAAVLILALIAWGIRRVTHPVRQPEFRYVPKAGLARNEIRYRQDSPTDSNSSDPFSLRPGLNKAESTLTFPR